MAIIIIDGFSVEKAGPIDSRIIATTSADRVALGLTSIGNPYSFVYDGLKCFQLDDRTNWVYNSGSGTWSAEGLGNVTTAAGRTKYLSFWTSSTALSYAPMVITQSGVVADSGLGIQKYLYLGGGGSQYESVFGVSSDNWITLGSSNNLNGVQIRTKTSNSDKINAGGQVSHQFFGDTSYSGVKLSNSTNYTILGLSSSKTLLSTDENLEIRTDDLSGAGKSITLNASDSSASNGGSIYLYSGGGLNNPGSISFITGIDATGFTKAGDINFQTSLGLGYYVNPKSGFVNVDTQFRTNFAQYERTIISSINNVSPSFDDVEHNMIVNNTGTSAISLYLPDLIGRYNGRKALIQCATFSNSITLTPSGTQKIYYNGSFVSTLALYRGYSVELLSINENWYVINSNFADESWKEVGAVGTMTNGQSIPTYGAKFTSAGVGTNLSLRRTKNSRINIRGNIVVSTNASVGDLICNIPIGYRPSVYTSIGGQKPIGGNYVPCYISAGGLYYGDTSSGILAGEYIFFPEYEYSLD